jgi:exopolyphosphatase / guanosine-5'-triphosphate,3'-diphosphate pyrophosphatase
MVMLRRPKQASPRPAQMRGQSAHYHDAPRRGSGQPDENYAALDLGTNNCRLLIARPVADGFTIIDAFSRIVRLGEGLAATGKLSDPAMDRAVAALAICAEKLKRRNVGIVRSVATEACRQASNGRHFRQRVLRETGIALEIISPEQEARLAVLGCHSLIAPGAGPALVFDIGGGSTELVLIEPGIDGPKILDWFSAPWGVVSLTESLAPAADRVGRIALYRAMRAKVADSMAAFATRLNGQAGGRLMGTSGTVTTLGSVHLRLPSYDRRLIDGLVTPTDIMRTLSTELAAASLSERAAISCIGRERADLIVAGCAILETILDLWPAAELTIADRGIREGILRLLMARDGHRW